MDVPPHLDALVSRDDLVFDVGANTGEKTLAFLALGARVVCFEPHRESAAALAQRFRDEPRVVVVPKGVASRAGTAELSICSEGSVYSTMAARWKEGRFGGHRWDRTEIVDTTTLDQAIAAHGRPRHVKIDVEGFEESVLRGLHQSVGSVAFEFTREFIGAAERCVRWLESLGFSDFNAVVGEGRRFLSSTWSRPAALFERLGRLEDPLLWGDVYARAPRGMGPLQLRSPEELGTGLDDMLVRLRGRSICRDIRTLYVIGAHRFEESSLLDELFPNLERIYLFDPLPEVQPALRQAAAQDRRVRVFPVAVSDRDATARFIRTDNGGMSSSLLRMKRHRQLFPEVHEVDEIEVQTRRLDGLIREQRLAPPDMLFLDVQGAEFSILASLTPNLRRAARLIYTEASTEEVYQSSRTLDEIRFLLAPRFVFLGFAPLGPTSPTHGNALFVASWSLRDAHRLSEPTGA